MEMAAGHRGPGLSDDAWQAYATGEAAKAIGQWLEARGRLHQPIAALRAAELEAIATAAISRWVLVASERIREAPPEETTGPIELLMP